MSMDNLMLLVGEENGSTAQVNTANKEAVGWVAGSIFEKPIPGDVARRIVACVNACVGIPTEDLERPRTMHANPIALNVLDSLRRFFSAGGAKAFPPGYVVKVEVGCLLHQEVRMDNRV